MCGIAGTIYNANAALRAAQLAMLIKHRGPDEGPQVVSCGKVSIAAVRLSIVDVQHGTQPMVDKNGSVIALNGEIYNHEKLRSALIKKGYRFKTGCDTETLLAGFLIDGPSFVKKLDGIFSIAYYDSRDKLLYLFRDYFGVKPLYYTNHSEGFEFSSEIKSFWGNGKKYKIDTDSLIYNHVFNWSDPSRTLYEEINTVLPGSYIVISPKTRLVTTHFFKPSKSPQTIDSYQAAVKQTYKTLISAVKSQIPSEVEWGVLLSGGVDSSILAWVSSQISRVPIRTFSVCSSEVDTEDLINARQVAKMIGSDHQEIRVNSSDALNHYIDYLYTIEDINSRFFFYYFLSRFMKGKVKVGLCGEGSDELYMGYGVYRDLEAFVTDAKRRWDIIQSLAKNIKPKIASYIQVLEERGLRSLYVGMIKDQLPWFQLNPVDKCSMKFGIELRVPYLSLQHSLSVSNYPLSYLKQGNIEKTLLRKAFKDSGLPTISRKKVFAGTRTLPTFYKQLEVLALKNNKKLAKQYPLAAKILSSKDLYTLSLLDKRLNETRLPDIREVKFIKIEHIN